MPNDLLIAVIRESGLDINEVAEIAEVDPRTVQRWLGGRIPHPRYRQKLAAALHTSPAKLWPEALTIKRREDLAEIAGAWAQRNDPDAIDWRALLRNAQHLVDLLGYSLSQILDTPTALEQLRAKATDGCQIRIAIIDPGSEPALAADLAQRPPGHLIARIRNAQAQLLDLIGETGIEIRQHQATTAHTILRFDDQLLLTIHLHGTPGFQAPLLHFRRDRDYGIHDQLAKHFEDIWNTAKPLAAPDAEPKPLRASAPRLADRLLDDLDYVWRPGTKPPRGPT